MRSDASATWLLVAALALGCLAPVRPASAGELRPLIVATYAYPGRDRAAAIQPLADYLARLGGRSAEVRLFDSPSALVEAMRSGEADIAVPNLHGFLQARQWPEQLAPLPVPEVPSVQADRYRAVIVARDGIDSLDALRREAPRLALVMVGRDSASGGFVPARGLRDMGLDPATGFASLAYAGSHAAALQVVEAGEADVAALASDVHDRSRPEGLGVLWRSGPIPPGPLLCRVAHDVPCARIADWLLQSHAQDAAVMAGLRDGWPEFGDADRFRQADVAGLDLLRAAIDGSTAGQPETRTSRSAP
ncbi:phosphate/phosphite/phosphonate ABC transporter substrate-binding protein [Luteimonas aestuarii]|nr:PhnD/SsuA/transferrin family substrate-binding protein [Luteimonas aestuarii]